MSVFLFVGSFKFFLERGGGISKFQKKKSLSDVHDILIIGNCIATIFRSYIFLTQEVNSDR